ncbi:hypothetical protein FA13DRAFT_127138 [Coprinellus micaceus]|uniref:Uncharacterized protein n=1 Tax=Coprinellus micaceus TaxID=71717 RepID=A0A4Y7TJ42_COPMI|nr:hypothetical protein FA13DRAFT_127138 [Coprinellus micaceus]
MTMKTMMKTWTPPSNNNPPPWPTPSTLLGPTTETSPETIHLLCPHALASIPLPFSFQYSYLFLFEPGFSLPFYPFVSLHIFIYLPFSFTYTNFPLVFSLSTKIPNHLYHTIYPTLLAPFLSASPFCRALRGGTVMISRASSPRPPVRLHPHLASPVPRTYLTRLVPSPARPPTSSPSLACTTDRQPPRLVYILASLIRILQIRPLVFSRTRLSTRLLCFPLACAGSPLSLVFDPDSASLCVESSPWSFPSQFRSKLTSFTRGAPQEEKGAIARWIQHDGAGPRMRVLSPGVED